MSEIIDKIQKLESTVNTNTVELAKHEERKKGLLEEREKYVTELKETKIDESSLETSVIDMKEELENEILKLEKELNES